VPALHSDFYSYIDHGFHGNIHHVDFVHMFVKSSCLPNVNGQLSSHIICSPYQS